MSQHPEAKERKHFCPYCEENLLMVELPYCHPCGVTLRYCLRCQLAVPKDAEACPQCDGGLD
ncbi:hypothetical protein ACFLX5_03320 [Chloroflexota bacterium]